ncbi:hypothetical protein FHT09_002047 [Xanthomonas arboricola]|nr:hypothetical protein [Xanthomonas sp. CFBP 8152]
MHNSQDLIKTQNASTFTLYNVNLINAAYVHGPVHQTARDRHTRTTPHPELPFPIPHSPFPIPHSPFPRSTKSIPHPTPKSLVAQNGKLKLFRFMILLLEVHLFSVTLGR